MRLNKLRNQVDDNLSPSELRSNQEYIPPNYQNYYPDK